MFRGFVWGVVVVFVFLLAYYVLYLLSFIYLRPYINYYLSIVNSSRVRVFNLAMLMIFISSPFNAYEAKILHTNPTTYFTQSVIASTLLMFIPLTLYNYAMVKVKLRVRPIIRPINFTLFAITASLLDSWIVSLIIWIALGAPSIGTSIYTLFQYTATAYIMVILAIQVTEGLHQFKYKSLFKALSALVIAVLMGVVTIVLVPIIGPGYKISKVHTMGLLIATILIYLYHHRHVVNIR